MLPLQVICRSAGGGTHGIGRGNDASSAAPDVPRYLSDVACYGDEPSVLLCDSLYTQDCSISNSCPFADFDLEVSCFDGK